MSGLLSVEVKCDKQGESRKERAELGNHYIIYQRYKTTTTLSLYPVHLLDIYQEIPTSNMQQSRLDPR